MFAKQVNEGNPTRPESTPSIQRVDSKASRSKLKKNKGEDWSFENPAEHSVSELLDGIVSGTNMPDHSAKKAALFQPHRNNGRAGNFSQKQGATKYASQNSQKFDLPEGKKNRPNNDSFEFDFN